MKRLFVGIMCLALLVATAMPTLAQTSRNQMYRNRGAVRSKQYKRYDNSRRANYNQRYNQRNRNQRYQDRSVWDEHRDVITVAGGTGAGAIVGGLAGGKKGAIIGALIGAGGSALYTYKLRDRDNRRNNRYR